MVNLDNAFLDHSQNFQTPQSSNFLRQKPINFSLRSPENRLYEHIKSNPKKFNILNENILFRTGTRIIKGSNLKSSIKRLINPTSENAPSPPGTSQLLSKINKDSISKRYFILGRDYYREERL